MDELLERLAKLEHEQWAHWTKYFVGNITRENLVKWDRQIDTPYEDLTEYEKDSDRAWALRVLDVVEQYHSSKESANK